MEAAAVEAEIELAGHPQTAEQVHRGLVRRTVRMVAGLALIAAGIVCLVIPGPGLVMIFAGLSMLPFAWAERTVQLIRRKTPGLRAR